MSDGVRWVGLKVAAGLGGVDESTMYRALRAGLVRCGRDAGDRANANGRPEAAARELAIDLRGSLRRRVVHGIDADASEG